MDLTLFDIKFWVFTASAVATGVFVGALAIAVLITICDRLWP